MLPPRVEVSEDRRLPPGVAAVCEWRDHQVRVVLRPGLSSQTTALLVAMLTTA